MVKEIEHIQCINPDEGGKRGNYSSPDSVLKKPICLKEKQSQCLTLCIINNGLWVANHILSIMGVIRGRMMGEVY